MDRWHLISGKWIVSVLAPYTILDGIALVLYQIWFQEHTRDKEKQTSPPESFYIFSAGLLYLVYQHYRRVNKVKPFHPLQSKIYSEDISLKKCFSFGCFSTLTLSFVLFDIHAEWYQLIFFLMCKFEVHALLNWRIKSMTAVVLSCRSKMLPCGSEWFWASVAECHTFFCRQMGTGTE